jgi:hypothetical protein
MRVRKIEKKIENRKPGFSLYDRKRQAEKKRKERKKEK